MRDKQIDHEAMCPVKGCYMPRHHSYIASINGVLVHQSAVPPDAATPEGGELPTPPRRTQPEHSPALGWFMVAALWLIGGTMLWAAPEVEGLLGVLLWVLGFSISVFGWVGFFTERAEAKQRRKDRS